MKQAALAQALGVSQPAVARWERGIDMPEPARLRRLEELMARTLRDELALERLFISRQSAVRALYDHDGMRMLAVSAGFRAMWPDFSNLMEAPMADHLVNEAQHLIREPTIRRAIAEGAIGLISGISTRHTDLQMDEAVHHHWHACFRHFGPRMLMDVVFEPCAPGLATGIVDIVYLDAIHEAEA